MSYKMYHVADPKTPYEYSSKDVFIGSISSEHEEQLKEQLEADARVVEDYIRHNKMMNLYECHILRVVHNGRGYVLGRDLRVEQLIKRLKIPFTVATVREGRGFRTTFSYVHIPSQ